MIGGDKQSLNSVFQIADITRPLMSVSKICDQGLFCFFGKEKAIIQNAEGKNVCEFQRRGGLYVATMKLERPTSGEGLLGKIASTEPFQRPER